MNNKLLNQVKAHIKEEPRRLYMSAWFMHGLNVKHRDNPPCGTAGCIAGWACDLSGKGMHGAFTGMEALKIRPPQALRLFYVDNWPKRYREAYHNSDSPKERAKICIARINRFQKTNGKS